MCVCVWGGPRVCCMLLCEHILEAITHNSEFLQYLAAVFPHNSCRTAVCVCCLQVMSHVAAAQSASMVFLCVHRENYDFLEALAHQLSGKVPPTSPSPLPVRRL